MNPLEEFRARSAVLSGAGYADVTAQLLDLLRWLEQEPIALSILGRLRKVDLKGILPPATSAGSPPENGRPSAKNRERTAAIGLHLIEVCRSQNSHLYSVCMDLKIEPAFETRRIQDFSDAGLVQYIKPFLGLVENGLMGAVESRSAAAVVGNRWGEILSAATRALLPRTTAIVESIAVGFSLPEDEVSWPRVAESCREALGALADEVRESCDLGVPPGLPEAGFKALLGSMFPPGECRETFGNWVEGTWNHAECLSRSEVTNKKEALRIYMWTCLAIGEFAEMAKTYRESLGRQT
jgi:hypothetical protein